MGYFSRMMAEAECNGYDREDIPTKRTKSYSSESVYSILVSNGFDSEEAKKIAEDLKQHGISEAKELARAMVP